jgi:hypothetical protein
MEFTDICHDGSMMNIWHIGGLQLTISILDKEHLCGKAFEVKVSYKSVFKLLVLDRDVIM